MGHLKPFVLILIFLPMAQAQMFIPFSFWGPKGTWRPTDLAGSLYAWYDADTPTSVRTGVAGVSQASSGDPVSVWQDLSGNGFDLAQSVGSRQPIYNSTGWGSDQPSIYIDAADDSLLNAAMTWQTYTVALVIRHSSVSNVRAIITKRSAVSANFFWFTWNSTSNSINWDQNGNRLNTTHIPTAGTNYIYVLVRPNTASSREKFVNGTSVITSSSNPNDNNANTMYLGNDYSAANRGADAHVAELIIINTNLGSTQRQQLEGYLAWKWGMAGSLPGSHPYSTYAP